MQNDFMDFENEITKIESYMLYKTSIKTSSKTFKHNFYIIYIIYCVKNIRIYKN